MVNPSPDLRPTSATKQQENERIAEVDWRFQPHLHNERMEVERRSLKVQPLYLYSVESERLRDFTIHYIGEDS